MKLKKNMEETKKEQELLEETINPEDIVMDEEDDDFDMPQPKTKTYKKYLKCSERFMSLFNKCVGTLPYGTVLTNPDGAKMRLVDFVRFIEQKKDKISVDEMNNFISYIAQLDFNHARPLMEVIENKEQQATLWALTEE